MKNRVAHRCLRIPVETYSRIERAAAMFQKEPADLLGLIGQHLSGKTAPNIYMTPGNLARLRVVAVALECDPAELLNNFLCDELGNPSGIAFVGMEFATDEDRRRVNAAVKPLDSDGWNCDTLALPMPDEHQSLARQIVAGASARRQGKASGKGSKRNRKPA